jgi:hypothetical protein
MEAESKSDARRAPSRPKRPSQSSILLVLTGLAIVAVVALPIVMQREKPATAADDARATYLALMTQMEAEGKEITEAAADDSSGAAHQTGRLDRDLFAPAPRRASPAVLGAGEGEGRTPVAATPARRRPPKLAGIFIDGAQARAVIGDQVVTVGETVKEFQVVEIHANWVLLKRGDQVEKLELGGGR